MMYVDSYRLKARQDRVLRHRDTGKVCYDDCFRFPHKWGSIGCRHRGEYIEQIVANPSVHSPFKLGKETAQDWDFYGKDIPVDCRSFGQH
jgi:hypothetical protein